MASRDIVVIGASAGGVQALLDMLQPLPANLPAALFIVVHSSPDKGGLLPEVLERGGAVNVTYAEDDEPIVHGRIYVARPDHHLLVKRDQVRVAHGPRENRFRPAIDPLFRTAARAYGPRVIGVILSGGLDDGTHGLELIKRHGGLAIAQDPEEAVMPTMPLSAIQNVEVDWILKATAIGTKLPLLVAEEVPDEAVGAIEGVDVAEGIPDNLQTGHIPGPPSPYTCPECGGSLWEIEDFKLLRYRCHVGHTMTADSLLAEQTDSLEDTLWSAVRALEEQASLRRRMAIHAEHVGRLRSARALQQEAKDVEVQAGALRRMLLQEIEPPRVTSTASETPLTATAGGSRRKRR